MPSDWLNGTAKLFGRFADDTSGRIGEADFPVQLGDEVLLVLLGEVDSLFIIKLFCFAGFWRLDRTGSLSGAEGFTCNITKLSHLHETMSVIYILNLIHII